MKSGYLVWRRLFGVTLLLAFTIALNGFFYGFFQKLTLPSAVSSDFMSSPLDSAIPLYAIFIVVYMTHLPFLSSVFYINILPNQFHLAEIFIHLARENPRFSGYISQKMLHYGERCARFWGALCDFVFGYENDGAAVVKIKVQTVLAYFFLIVSTNAVYYFWPLKVSRPNIKELVDIGADFLRWLYRHDAPNNSFPSQHAAFATLVFLIFNRLRTTPVVCYIVLPFARNPPAGGVCISAMGAIAGVWALLIIISTYFTKQHIIADSLAGILFAYIAFRVGFSEGLYVRLEKLGRLFVKQKQI